MLMYWADEVELYNGTQLRSLHSYMRWGLLGDSIVAWRGPCNVPLSHMVDGEDARAKSAIRGDDMVHFIVELFAKDLVFAVAMQRLMASHAQSLIREIVGDQGPYLSRSGDDLYVGERKLSISVATKSPVSSLIHFALNVVNDGTPVPTISLSDFSVDPKDFASELMARIVDEYHSIVQATCKVFAVP